MNKARTLIHEYSARLEPINGRTGLRVASASLLTSHVGPMLQLLPLTGPGGSADVAEKPVLSHRPMNDREVMVLLVKAAAMTAGVQGGLDERVLAELREIRQRLSDAIPGMTFPRPTSGPIAATLNEMLLIFSQAQAGKKLDDIETIRKIQALTW
ncbi:hypothetical protein N825_25505 [Skermanella stibiiresistens SB22]|uniref:Uncharacterized protein n=1 Tax=Skermanella stibiiresistens SB22 TaxID=1385369 RepID=W9GSR3_9PROT|nr:hypothetical protein [Skermanella stibiiresistens]EWY36794.1 hypothetical protein N825_25505 [Skermanella stibiiresistens SB22]